MEGKHCFPIGVNNCKKSDLTLPIASFPRIVSRIGNGCKELIRLFYLEMQAFLRCATE